MSEFYEHNPDDHEDPAPGPTWLIGFIGTALLVVIVLGLTAIYQRGLDDEDAAKVLAVEPMDLEAIKAAQRRRLEGTPHWAVTRLDGVETDRRLVVPIDVAMEQVVKEYGR